MPKSIRSILFASICVDKLIFKTTVAACALNFRIFNKIHAKTYMLPRKRTLLHLHH